MNKTKIDWADYSWNPITGCLHDCEYCYARRIAERFGREYKGLKNYEGIEVLEKPFESYTKHMDIKIDPYPYGFEPTFHKYRLTEPSRKTKGVTIFVCSMADLFGKWVPDEWIKEVFEACKKAPQHRYLFLTKNPKRYSQVYRDYNDYREYIWFGATATDDKSFYNVGYELFESTGYDEQKRANRFLSIEPLLERISTITLGNIEYIDWIIVGAETGNTKNKVIPKKEWIMAIKEQCKASGVPLFMKESLRELMGEDFIQEFPW